MFSELIPALPWSFLFIQDLIGTIVFAISGAIAARQHKMDIFGMFILAFVTASLIGGVIFVAANSVGLESDWVYLATVFTVIIIRLLAIRFNLNLPRL